jgi:uncharacterized protein (TIGR03435 family)
MAVRLTSIAVLTAALASLQAQSPPAAPPSFEVTSVRRNTSGAGRRSFQLPERGTVTGTNVTVHLMILQAYQANRFAVVVPRDHPLMDPGPAAPAFDVQIKPSDNAPPGQARLLLQQLLADRFKLRVHRETRPTPVYVLTAAREGQFGPELRPADQDCASYIAARRIDPQAAEPHDRHGTPLCIGQLPPRLPGVTFMRNAGSVANLVRQIQAFVDRFVVDETGLTGNVEWTLSFALNPLDGDHPSIFTAIQEQLGLTLTARTMPREVLVVDSVDWPTPN